MNGYQKLIHEATGETDVRRLAEIEEIMRQDIYHSTLDWQSRADLMDAARLAVEFMQA